MNNNPELGLSPNDKSFISDEKANELADSLKEPERELLANRNYLKFSYGQILYGITLLEQAQLDEEVAEEEHQIKIFDDLLRGKSLQDVIKEQRGNFSWLQHHIRNSGILFSMRQNEDDKEIAVENIDKALELGIISQEEAEGAKDPKNIAGGVIDDFISMMLGRSDLPEKEKLELETAKQVALEKSKKIEEDLAEQH